MKKLGLSSVSKFLQKWILAVKPSLTRFRARWVFNRMINSLPTIQYNYCIFNGCPPSTENRLRRAITSEGLALQAPFYSLHSSWLRQGSNPCSQVLYAEHCNQSVITQHAAKHAVEFKSSSNITGSFIHSFIQAFSIAPLQVRYYSEALSTQHGYCSGVSRRSATGNCELRTCLRSQSGG